jgi:hypothetical protein
MYPVSQARLAVPGRPIARVSLHSQDGYAAVVRALADQLCGATWRRHCATRASQAADLSCSDIYPGA